MHRQCLCAQRVLVLALAFALPAATALAQSGTLKHPIRIRIRVGAVSTQVTGRLTAKTEGHYVIKADKGDHLLVNIIPTSKLLLTAGDVTPPSGDSGDGGHGGIIFNHDLQVAGDYQIRVGLNTMGAEANTGTFILEVVITPAYLKDSASLRGPERIEASAPRRSRRRSRPRSITRNFSGDNLTYKTLAG